MVRYARPEFAAVDKTALAQNRLAAGIYLTSMGLPFWQAGEEFARTKKGQGNSYHSSPALNRLDWHRPNSSTALWITTAGSLVCGRRSPAGRAGQGRPCRHRVLPAGTASCGWRLPAQWATAQRGAPCASTITPPRRRRLSPCPAQLEAAERRHLLQPVAGQQPHLHRPDRPPAPERHRVRAGIKIRSAVA